MSSKIDSAAVPIRKVPLLLFPIILYSMFILTAVFVTISMLLVPLRGAPSGLVWLFSPPSRAAMTSYILAGFLAAGTIWLWAARGGFTGLIVPFAKPYARYWLWAVLALVAEWSIAIGTTWDKISLHGISSPTALYHYPAAFALMTVYAVLVGPLCEEILFRGFGYGYLMARGVNRWITGAVIAFLFLLMHWPIFGLATTLTIIPIAILLSVLRIVSGNLTPGVILHVANNIVAFLVFPMLIAQ